VNPGKSGIVKASGSDQFIMCLIKGEYDQAKAAKIQAEFQKKYTTKLFRLDHISKKFLITFDNGKISIAQVTEFFKSQGLSVTCATLGTQGVDAYPDLTKCKDK
jgi:hypothetical protein